MHFLNVVKKLDVPDNQYYKEDCEKTQIVLHHTVSGPNVNGVLSTWVNSPERVATCVIIDRNGICYQIFSSKQWAHHLGIKSDTFKKFNIPDNGSNNIVLNKKSIGIELINWGGLTMQGGDFINSYGKKVVTDAIEYPQLYRGYRYFERYTESQLKTLGSLLLYFNIKYNIPLEYRPEMFQTSLDALRGVPGVWSHTSYRIDKSDVHPDPNLIDMLKSIDKKVM